MAKKQRKPFHEEVAEKLIRQLEEGTAPWQKPWSTAGVAGAGYAPMNPVTGTRYKGINFIQLMSAGHDDPRWMTYKQAQKLGYQVRKGEKSTPVQYWKFDEEQVVRDSQGNPIKDSKGKEVKQRVKLERPRVFFASVFNASQIDGIPPLELAEHQKLIENICDQVETLADDFRPEIASELKEQANQVHRANTRPTGGDPVQMAHSLVLATSEHMDLDGSDKHRTAKAEMDNALEALDKLSWERDQRAETLLANSGARIEHAGGDNAFYSPSLDKIRLPLKEQFSNGADYYRVALHELGHWTGHPSRLDRDLSGGFGSISYAKEELRAEISSLMVGGELALGHDPGQHASYVQSWIKVLKEDSMEIFRAAADAEKIYKLVMSFEQVQEQEQERQQGQELNEYQSQALQHLSLHNGLDQLNGQHLAFLSKSQQENTAAVGAAIELAAEFNLPLTDEGFTYSTISNLNHYRDAMLGDNSVSFVMDKVDSESREVHYIFNAESSQVKHLVKANFHENRAEVTGAIDKESGARLEPDQKQFFADVKGLTPKLLDDLHMSTAVEKHNQLSQGMAAKDDRRLSVIQMQQLADLIVSVRKEEITGQTFEDKAKELGCGLSAEWDGRYRVIGMAMTTEMGDSVAESAEHLGLEPEFFSVYTTDAGEMSRLLDDFPTQDEALAYARDVGMVAALAEENDLERTAKLARVEEEAVKADPNSTEEMVIAAKEARKAAEYTAMKHAQPRERIYINVPFKEKNQAKELGAKWDSDNQRWYIPPGVNKEAFTQWMEPERNIIIGAPKELTPENQKHLAQLVQSVRQGNLKAKDFEDQAESLGCPLPASWNGGVDLQANTTVEIDGQVHVEPAGQEEAKFHSVYARDGEGFATWLKDFPERQQAEKYAQAVTQVSGMAKGLTMDQTKAERTYINVPFKEKNQAKEMGAKWDGGKRSWFVPAGVDTAPFEKWMKSPEQSQPAQQEAPQQAAAPEREYLAVPYEERRDAKALGAKWDGTAKAWFVSELATTEQRQALVNKWSPEKVRSQEPAMSPQEEFAEALRSMGAIVDGQHPMMDGQKHRIACEGDKRGEQAGFYIGHLDGHPAGYISNNRTGQEMKWKSKGYSLSPEEKAKLQAEAAAKLEARRKAQAEAYSKAADRVTGQLEKLQPISQATPYLQSKEVAPKAGIYTDREGKTTYIPAQDKNGKTWTMQYIREDGRKRFAKDSMKEGTFHIVGGKDKLDQASVIVIGEGYATAGTAMEALDMPATVAAFDSGNLKPVAEAMREMYPDKPILIAGDDDLGVKLKEGFNPGVDKAKEAAAAVGAAVVFPTFGKDEQSKTPKAFSDFNDLAVKSSLGKDAARGQLQTGVEKAKLAHAVWQKQNQEQRQEKRQVQEQEKVKKRGFSR